MTSPASHPSHVDLLILGGGWTYGFLQPLLIKSHPDISFAATTRDGRDGSIKWAWDQEGGDRDQYKTLPKAKTVCVTFPIKGAGGSTAIVEGYERQHGPVRWIQLGSSGIWDGGPTLRVKEKNPYFEWTDRHSPFATDNPRAIAEEELLDLRSDSFVLNLSGLWGGSRDPINWVSRVAPTKEAVAGKASIHLIHGLDVARAIVAVHLSPSNKSSVTSPPAYEAAAHMADGKKQRGERYLLTDLRVYDWWDLILAWGMPPIAASSSSPAPTHYSPGLNGAPLLGAQPGWVLELMNEQKVRAVPRSPEQLGRALDSSAFWTDFGIVPVKGRIERGRLAMSVPESPSSITPTSATAADSNPPQDVDGNIYTIQPPLKNLSFTSHTTGNIHFLSPNEVAKDVFELVRCTLLPDNELDALFNAHSSESSITTGDGIKIDQVTFQRFKVNEDRTFSLAFEHGVLAGVFDGHVGHQLSHHTSLVFPSLLAAAISTAYATQPPSADLISTISTAISAAFIEYDGSVGSAATKYFEAKPIEEWTEEEVKQVLEEPEHNDVVRRAMAGTTALVAFVSRDKKDVWVAGVGDCQGFLGREEVDEGVAKPLNVEHNGKTPSEVERIRKEHPGEEDTVVVGDRVLSSIAITRAFGDFPFKFPAAWSHRVFQHATPPFVRFSKLASSLEHSHTPPYISALPSISHRSLRPGDIIVLSSDGLGDSSLVGAMAPEVKAKAVTALAKGEVVGDVLGEYAKNVRLDLVEKTEGDNAARRVLENVLWGTDRERMAFELTAELPDGGALQDDISVVVVTV
ncbi:hypothetical protein RQP46_011353 [Phenoliferia psychrophenolica]